ncbi:hypothetical protein IW140_005464 [Coemansia sp. RSA 1813]|nr:hypothetical protein EV178_005438 [Coemansia sp. RSA 1646]KAJ1767503.1 hypothetical protein LPJ74_005330 [Coemansia sp. RSA 1843]KAJ2086770.1 hypothetical protein IW138_005448 [Coemansia sp. RSA 986]KAJ2211572.1 hypothetical protein EV179_005383 [Coemansia sp. RSA 487]KAJ2565124.1 hypothetical protein IW140_005464 [Coemansia sp. RSA 1813]
MSLQKQVRFSSQIDIIQPLEYTEHSPASPSISSISDDSADPSSPADAVLQHKYRRPKGNKAHSSSSLLGVRARATKESILGDLSRYTQEAYICPFCSSNSKTYADQLIHLEVVHPWYDLDVHRNMR